MAQTPFQLFEDALRAHPVNLKVKLRSKSIQCRCPAHQGQSNDLSITEMGDGGLRVKCFAACTTKAVVSALGLTVRDCFPDNSEFRHGKPVRRKSKFGQYTQDVEVKNPDGSEETIKVTFTHRCTYEYHDEDVKILYERLRWEPSDTRARKRFTVQRRTPNNQIIDKLQEGWHEWQAWAGKWIPIDGATDRDHPPSAAAEWFDAPRRVLFNLPFLTQAIRDKVEDCYLNEGEPDSLCGRRIGLITTTSDSGASSWLNTYSQTLAQFKRIIIVADPDPAGIKGAYLKAEAIKDFGPKVVTVFPAVGDFEDHINAGLDEHSLIAFDHEEEMAWITKECHDSSEPAEAVHSTPAPPSASKPTLHELHSDKLPINDLESAEFFVGYVGKNLRYCASYACYLEWDGTRYKRDDKNASNMARYQPFAKKLMKAAVGQVMDAGGFNPDRREMSEEEKKAWDKANSRVVTARKLQNVGGIKAVEYIARQLYPMPVSPDDLDTQKDLLPVLNGTIDLRSSKLIPSNPDHLFTKRAEVLYDSNALCPEWFKLLDYAFEDDADMIDYLRLVLGYSLTGHETEHCCFFFYGVPRSGKSTIMNTCFELVGDFYRDLSKAFVMQNRGNENIAEHFARLKDARMVSVIEVMAKDRFDEGLIKKFTGSEKLTARAPFEKSVTFDFTGKIWISGNERPQITEQGEAIWTRFRPIIFNRAVPFEDRDQGLPAKLKSELPGILNWALTGAEDWYNAGRLPIPKKVEEQIAEYRVDVDDIGRFLRECTINAPGERVYGKALLDIYERWCKATKTWMRPSKLFYQDLKVRTDHSYRRDGDGWSLRNRQSLLPELWRLGLSKEEEAEDQKETE